MLDSYKRADNLGNCFSPMFRAINTESEVQRKAAKIENAKIVQLYLDALENRKYDAFLEFSVLYDQNKSLYNKGRSNLFYNYVMETDVETLNENKEKLDFLEYKLAVFALVEKNIKAGNYVRAKKLLNFARTKGWICNNLYKLEERIKAEYFDGLG